MAKPVRMETQTMESQQNETVEQDVFRQLNRAFTRIEIMIYLVSVLIVFGTIGYLGVKTAGSLLGRVI